MLNLNCAICAELFSQTDDVRATVCGHMFHYVCLTQWLERSKTCPQCRYECTEQSIIRLYFNQANLDIDIIDALQAEVKNSKLQMQIKEEELQKAEQEIKELKKLEEQIKYLNDYQERNAKFITKLQNDITEKDYFIEQHNRLVAQISFNGRNIEDLYKMTKSNELKLEIALDMRGILDGSKDKVKKRSSEIKDPILLNKYAEVLENMLQDSLKQRKQLEDLLSEREEDLQRANNQIRVLEKRVELVAKKGVELTEDLDQTLQKMTRSLRELQ